MRSITPLLIAVCLALTACADPQVQQHAQAAKQYEEVLGIIARADAGYIPATSNAPPKMDLQDYRLQKYTEALAMLKEVQQNGSERTQVAAYRTAADLHTALARRQARQALSAWGSIANQSSNLMSFMIAVEMADRRAAMLSRDESPLLNALKSFQASDAGQVRALEQDVQQHRGTITDLDRQIAEQEQVRDTAMAKALQLRAQALGTDDKPGSYDLLDQADAEQRRAEQAAATAEELRVRHAVFSSELVLLEQKMQLVNRAAGIVGDQVKSTEQRQAELVRLRDEALNEKAKAYQSLFTLFDKLVADFNQKVTGPTDAAIAQMTQATGALQSASSRAVVDEKQDVRLELLSKQTTLANILTNQIVATAALGHSMDALADRAAKANLDRTPQLQSSAAAVRERHGQLLGSAQSTIADAQQIVSELASRGEGDPNVTSAAEHGALLTAYERRITATRLPGVTPTNLSAPSAPESVPATAPEAAPASEAPAPEAPAAPAVGGDEPNK